ncbi:hypothetical protein LHL20_00230 [Alteromonas sp. McT4-15]|jgi:uncharacterized membrane protein YdcZ (DUF606 family)|uniref:hypothetical protein n=1 Tax=unclassified Alteromonas TaxID=2614992 RepID=UPI0012E64A1F|nr:MULTISPECIES: hypothetical protein [unclassified Alteromonas]MEC8230424.1 hypothetical protein [Pseudomonadota bacterium]GFD89313.1 hypothetical protein KUL152_15390 [Tenacibaculum sp. KUL152]MCB4434662.1 hypothetical protein [Alteromonas sp. McT4-15]WDT86054.1 hypothetical protein OZ660_19310 [Alteromonas sp. 009811495]BCO20998.1 hypothetical protein KUC3_38550 [Alteromonas sp. KC3]
MAIVFWAFLVSVVAGLLQLYILGDVIERMSDNVKLATYFVSGGVTGLVFVATRWLLLKRSKSET